MTDSKEPGQGTSKGDLSKQTPEVSLVIFFLFNSTKSSLTQLKPIFFPKNLLVYIKKAGLSLDKILHI